MKLVLKITWIQEVVYLFLLGLSLGHLESQGLMNLIKWTMTPLTFLAIILVFISCGIFYKMITNGQVKNKLQNKVAPSLKKGLPSLVNLLRDGFGIFIALSLLDTQSKAPELKTLGYLILTKTILMILFKVLTFLLHKKIKNETSNPQEVV